MFRIELAGRSPRVLRGDELAASATRRKTSCGMEEGPSGPCVLEWLSPTGVILRRHACASWAELRAQIPDLLLDTVAPAALREAVDPV